MNVVKGNPNASVAAASTAAGVLLIWLLTSLGVDISPEVGAAISGLLASVVLWIGRDGIKGAISKVWGGDKPPPKPVSVQPTRSTKPKGK
jgi:hypothetical protein